ncbi:MAG: anti-sigma factor antagonist [Marinilabiliales bacterium]
MIQVNKIKDIIVINLDESITKFTLQNCQEIKEEINKVINNQRIKLIFDLNGIRYVDSSGIAVLISVLKTVNNIGGKLILTNISKEVMDLIKLMQLDRIFQTASSMNEAIEKISE